jgi:hypothetical protein
MIVAALRPWERFLDKNWLSCELRIGDTVLCVKKILLQHVVLRNGAGMYESLGGWSTPHKTIRRKKANGIPFG